MSCVCQCVGVEGVVCLMCVSVGVEGVVCLMCVGVVGGLVCAKGEEGLGLKLQTSYYSSHKHGYCMLLSPRGVRKGSLYNPPSPQILQ